LEWRHLWIAPFIIEREGVFDYCWGSSIVISCRHMEMMIAKKGCDTDFLPASHRGISKKAAFCIHSPMFIVYCERFFLLCFYVCLFVCFCCSVFLFQVWQKCIVCFLKISAFVANVSFPEVFVHISSMFYKRKIIVACRVVKWKKGPI